MRVGRGLREANVHKSFKLCISLPWGLKDTLIVNTLYIKHVVLTFFIHLSGWLAIFLSTYHVLLSSPWKYLIRTLNWEDLVPKTIIAETMHIAMCCYLLRFDLLAMVTADSSCRIQKIKSVLLTYSYSEYFSTEQPYYCLLPCSTLNANMRYEAATFLLCRLRRTDTTLLVASYYIQLGGI